MGAGVATQDPVSRTEQVAADLRAAIVRGDYPRGSQLPSEDDLARRYDVARSVVNTAMRELRAEGLVRAERGRGTVVAEIPSITRPAMARYARGARDGAGERGASSGETRGRGMEPGSEVRVGGVVPPREVAEQVGLAAGVEVIARQREMYADNGPVQLATSYIPADIA